MDKRIVESIWHDVSEEVKDEIMIPSIFDALEYAVPIDVQDNKFIIGFAAQNTPKAGYLTSASTLPLIERCLSSNMKMPMKLMVVEGTSMEEYLAHKELLESARVAIHKSVSGREEQRKIENAWENVGEKCIRGFSAVENKGFAVNKAMYIKKAFSIIDETAVSFNYKYGDNPLHDRCLSRIFDRLEKALELPAGLLAYDYFLAKEAGKIDKLN